MCKQLIIEAAIVGLATILVGVCVQELLKKTIIKLWRTTWGNQDMSMRWHNQQHEDHVEPYDDTDIWEKEIDNKPHLESKEKEIKNEENCSLKSLIQLLDLCEINFNNTLKDIIID